MLTLIVFAETFVSAVTSADVNAFADPEAFKVLESLTKPAVAPPIDARSAAWILVPAASSILTEAELAVSILSPEVP